MAVGAQTGNVILKFELKFNMFWWLWWSPYEIISTDFDSYAVLYERRTTFFSRKYFDLIWIISRRPLDVSKNESERDPYDPDVQEFDRIMALAMNIIIEKIPDFKLTSLYQTIQGDGKGCIYDQ